MTGTRATRGVLGSAGLLVAFVLAGAQHSIGAEGVTATLLYQQFDAGTYRYNVVLQDSGSTNVGTLWYAWVPGEDFLPASPTNLVAPAGWDVTVTHGAASDGYAVRWINNGATAFTPGESLRGFGFDSTETPAQLLGNSPAFPTTPISTTFIYTGQPFSDAGVQFNINPTTHPWQNPLAPTDVDDDGTLSSRDALSLIHALVAGGPHVLGTPTANDAPPFVDVDGDGQLTSSDALAVIHQLVLNSRSATPLALSPPTSLSPPLAVPEPASSTLALLAALFMALAVGRRRRRCR